VTASPARPYRLPTVQRSAGLTTATRRAYLPAMRPLFLAALLLVACSADPVPQPLCTPGASSACTCPSGASGAQVCDVTRVLGPCVCGSDAAVDAALVDGTAADAPASEASTDDATAAPCVPACAAGARCERGACVAFDGGATDAPGDAGADVPPLSDAARAMLLRTCEPLGSECAPGLTCLAYFADAGGQGTCNFRCDTTDDCRALDPRSVCSSMVSASMKVCVIGCDTRTLPCPAGGFGTCRPRTPSPDGPGVCAP